MEKGLLSFFKNIHFFTYLSSIIIGLLQGISAHLIPKNKSIHINTWHHTSKLCLHVVLQYTKGIGEQTEGEAPKIFNNPIKFFFRINTHLIRIKSRPLYTNIGTFKEKKKPKKKKENKPNTLRLFCRWYLLSK